MNNDSPMKAVLVVVLVALVTSSLVSAAVVMLRPIQMNNLLLDRSRNIVQLTGLLPAGVIPPDEEMLGLYKSLDLRVVDLDTGEFATQAMPSPRDREDDELATVYLVWVDNDFTRIILPISGEGMWSTLHGYIALEPDLNTIADATFYDQQETPGLGDQITRPDWLAQWKGRRIYDERGDLRFAVAGGMVDPSSSTAVYEVDALTGATVTADAVTRLVHYWFGPHGYQPLIAHMNELKRDRALIESAATEVN